MKVKGLILICMLLMAGGFWSHPLHLSFTNLEYKTGASRWELTVKIFSDVWFDEREIPAGTWTLKGWKNKEAAVWMTFTFQEAMPVNQVRITNRLLLDLYPDQKNLFIFTMGQIQSSHEFNGKRTEAVITLNK